MSSFKEDVKADLGRIRLMIVAGCAIGAFLCIFQNNIAVAAASSPMGALMGSMYVTMYNKAMCLMPLLIIGAVSMIMLIFRPRMKGRQVTGTAASHITAVAIGLIVAEVVIMICHLCVILIRNGSLDGFAYVPVAYIGIIGIGLFFASVGLAASTLIKDPQKGMMATMAIAGWCLLASFIGMMGLDTMITLGAGAEWCNYMYYFTVSGFVDVDSLVTIGTANPDYTCLWYYLALYILDIVVIGIGLWGERRSASKAAETAVAE